VEYQSVGANLLWTPRDNIELEYTFQLERTDQDTPPLLNLTQPNQVLCLFFGVCAPDVRTPLSGDRYATVQDLVGPDDATFDADTHIFELRWDIDDDLRLDYIFGSWETKETVLTDWDGAPALFFHTTRPAEYKQTSHELRLTGSTGEKLTWVMGAYAWDSEYEVRLRSYICFGCVLPGGLLDLPQTTNQTTDSWALFFEGDYNLMENLTLTVGGRFTEDRKDTLQTGVVTLAAPAKESWDKFTPKLGLKYRFNDDAMVYATYSQGYRSGGFNGRVDSEPTAEDPYFNETVDSYEIGFKTEWLDNRLRLNVTAFYMDYNDKQEELQLPSATSGTGQVTKVVNASTATMKGLEADLLWYPVEGLSIRGNLGILDAGYDEFEFAAVGGGTTDLSHLNFRRAPKVTASISGNYEWAVGSGTAVVGGGWHYIGAHEVDFANKPELTNEAQHLLDASVGYRLNSIEVNFFARNIAKADGYSIGFDVAGLWSYAATRAPRTYGFEVNYRFGE
jgi:iron complex outermembrane receptor protein